MVNVDLTTICHSHPGHGPQMQPLPLSHLPVRGQKPASSWPAVEFNCVTLALIAQLPSSLFCSGWRPFLPSLTPVAFLTGDTGLIIAHMYAAGLLEQLACNLARFTNSQTFTKQSRRVLPLTDHNTAQATPWYAITRSVCPSADLTRTWVSSSYTHRNGNRPSSSLKAASQYYYLAQ